MNKAYETVESYFIPQDLHEKERVDNGDEILTLVISIVWTCLHGLNSYWLFWGHTSLVVAAIIHIVLFLIAALITWSFARLARDIRYGYVLSIASLGAGVFGAFGMVISCVASLYYNMVSLPFLHWYQTIFPRDIVSREEEIYDLIETGKDEGAKIYNVVPFIDVITLGTESQKRRALSRMTDQFSPTFAPAYKKALQDDSNAIRVQAASSIGKIENQFTSMLMKIEKLEDKYPDDMRIKLGLARYYDSYAFTGLLDSSREEENRIKALEKYREYLEGRPEDIEARIEAGRLLLRSGEHEQVLQLFNDCIEAGYGNDTLKLWMVEAMFEAGRYKDLRRIAPECASMMEEIKTVQPRLVNAIEYWGASDEQHA
jgi:polysaccharide biosynthesis protein PelE